MNRIERALKAYENFRELQSRMDGGNRYKGGFYADDVTALLRRADKKPVGSSCLVLFDALAAGWMLGYESAQRERGGGALIELLQQLKKDSANSVAAASGACVPEDGVNSAETAGDLEPLGEVLSRTFSETSVVKCGKVEGGANIAR